MLNKLNDGVLTFDPIKVSVFTKYNYNNIIRIIDVLGDLDYHRNHILCNLFTDWTGAFDQK